ncbi:MAG: peptide methionine sulfoxide reductase [Saprospiraceae bacterium]
MSLHEIIINIPSGYSEVYYNNRKYGLTRTDFNEGKSLKIFAEELGGTDFISFNYYITSQDEYLKPCEMPAQKVRDFLLNFKI